MRKQKEEKKKLSTSLKILISSGTLLIVFTISILYLMAEKEMPEPSTLILSFFGAFGIVEGVSGLMQMMDNKYNPKDSCDADFDVDGTVTVDYDDMG